MLGAALQVSLASVAVKLAASAKEIAVAGIYGRSDAMDAFLAAALIPGLLVNLISESLNQALVPTLVRVRESEGREQAQQLLSSAMLWMVVLLAAVSAVMLVGAQGFIPLFASHFAPEKLTLSIRLFRWMVPVVLVTGVATNCTAVLNTLNRYAGPALAPIVISVAVLAGALGFGRQFGIWAMVWSTVAGSVAHAAIVAWMMRRQGYSLEFRWYGMTEAAREVVSQYWPVLLSSVVASGGLLVDQAMAAMLVAGSVSALVYANRFVSVVLTLVGGALGSALTPHFSELVARSEWAQCRRSLRNWMLTAGAIAIPVAVLLIGAANGLVRLAFERGAFHAADTAVVARVLAMYAIQIPFFVVSRVPYRLLIAMRRTDLVLYCGVVNLVLDVVLNLVLMRWMGVAGIALATSLWTVATLIFLGYWAERLLKERIEGAGPEMQSAETGNAATDAGEE